MNRWFGCFIVVLSLQLSASTKLEVCMSPIRSDTMERIVTKDLNTLKLLIDQRQCTEEWSTHDQAVAAGFSWGSVVYGVPVTQGGTFSKSQRIRGNVRTVRQTH